MAAEPKKTEEGEDLSMEEILQSIRKIIADEDKPVEASENNDELSGAIGSDVLELTDIIEEAPARDVLQEIDDAFGTDEPQQTIAEEAAEETVLELTEEPEEIQAAPEPVAPPAPVTPVASATSPADRLISDQAASASAKAFQKVIQTHKATTPMPHFRNNETIEDLVLETLKPLLKEWLDTHLPSMVERIVEREISKLVE